MKISEAPVVGGGEQGGDDAGSVVVGGRCRERGRLGRSVLGRKLGGSWAEAAAGRSVRSALQGRHACKPEAGQAVQFL